MTIQTLFDRMMLSDNELDLIAGGADVTRGLVAVNWVQDWWEAVAAQYANFLQTHETFTTTANQEYTTWPTRLKRVDGDLWLENTTTDRPARPIPRIEGVGTHVAGASWPFSELQFGASEGNGVPREYAAEGPGGTFLWTPVPDAVYTIRAYGLWTKADYTAAANTFLYPDDIALVLPVWAGKLFRTGLDRDLEAIQLAAQEAFRPVIRNLNKYVRDYAPSRQYSEYHEA